MTFYNMPRRERLAEGGSSGRGCPSLLQEGPTGSYLGTKPPGSLKLSPGLHGALWHLTQLYSKVLVLNKYPACYSLPENPN